MLQDHYFTNEDSQTIKNSIGKGIVNVDIGYMLLFDKKDYNKLNKFYSNIRESKDPFLKNELLEYYEQFLTRKYQDKTVCYEYIPEPCHVSYKADRVVFSGLERLAQLATGRSNNTFNDYGIGTGTTPVLPADSRLEFQEARVRIDETGFAESKGSSMVFAAIFPSSVPTISVSESAIFDNPAPPETMFLRTVYEGANIVEHTFNQTLVAVSHFIYLLSV